MLRWETTTCSPTEVFLLSRLDQPMPLHELLAISGLGEEETLALLYSLALAGLVEREHWISAFRRPDSRAAHSKND